MMKLLPFLLALSFLSPRPSLAWHSCDTDGAGGDDEVCPTGNKCCRAPSSSSSGNDGTGAVAGADELFRSRTTTSYCISGKNTSLGDCCTNYNDDGMMTGCGAGFECAYDDILNDHYCKRFDYSNPNIPMEVTRGPRYRLCSLPKDALQQVHGLQVDESNPSAPQAAYLSTMGSIDSGDDSTLLERHAKVHTVVVVIHGSNRNADDYLCATNSALPASDRDPSTSSIMVIAPWFLSDEDREVPLYNKPIDVKPIRWLEDGPIYHTWRYGADSVNLNNFSAYQVADVLLERIVQDNVRFPSLQRIVVVGHSAGGQYTQRWALLSRSWVFSSSSSPSSVLSSSSDAAAQVMAATRPSGPVSVRVVVANPKSFCFLDERRFVNDAFRVPSPYDIADCPDYNEWEWGLGDNGNFLPTPYKDRAVEKAAGGKHGVVHRYGERDVVYLAGANDFAMNGMCMAKMQGPFRRSRSKHFFRSLKEIYGRQVHHRLVVAGVYHDHGLMFQSPEGYQALFGLMGSSSNNNTRTVGEAVSPEEIK